MFKKKPQIKNISPLRSSERRKLADQIRRDYSIPDPPAPSEGEEPQQTVTSLRNALLPESTSSAKFTTTHGPNSAPIAGTVFVGAYSGREERILWFQVGKDERLIPTVYTLWQNPGLVPLLYTGDPVVGKLRGGADLFAPGIIRPSNGIDPRAKKGAVVAVAGISTATIPRWVGACDVDLTKLAEGTGGTAARGLHWEGDELWNWSAMGKGGQAAPEVIEGWQRQTSNTEITKGVEHMDLEDSEDDDNEEETAGGVALESSTTDLADRSTTNGHTEDAGQEQQQQEPTEDERIPTTKEVDDAFLEAFLYAVYDAKKSNPSEPHGLVFPIQPSFLISNMIQPHLRFQSPHYTIKKTSWKNTKKFIKQLDKLLLVKSKDRNGGETVILDIDFNDQQVKSFQPYRLPKPKAATEDPATNDNADSSSGAAGDNSLGQRLAIQTLYRASSRLIPNLLSSKTAFYTAQQITAALKQYIESQPGLVNEAKKRYVKLDPFLANNVLGSNPSTDDTKALNSGEIDRGSLQRRILDDDHLCIPYHVLLRNDQTFNTEATSDASLKPKAGPPPKITLPIERRGGNKVVTAIAGLEAFFINPQLIKPELQKKCAGSASIGQLMGGKPGTMEVQVQGDQRAIIEKEILGKRGVKPEWIEVVDKTKKKGKK